MTDLERLELIIRRLEATRAYSADINGLLHDLIGALAVINVRLVEKKAEGEQH